MITKEQQNRELLTAVNEADSALMKVYRLLREHRRDLLGGFAEKHGAIIAPIQSQLTEELTK